MNIKTKKIISFCFTTFLVFALINSVLVNESFAMGGNFVGPKTVLGATILKGLVVGCEILAAGFFTVRFTWAGIQYFIAVSADEKASNRNKLKWTLLYTVLTFFALFLFSRAVGL